MTPLAAQRERAAGTAASIGRGVVRPANGAAEGGTTAAAAALAGAISDPLRVEVTATPISLEWAARAARSAT